VLDRVDLPVQTSLFIGGCAWTKLKTLELRKVVMETENVMTMIPLSLETFVYDEPRIDINPPERFEAPADDDIRRFAPNIQTVTITREPINQDIIRQRRGFYD